MVAVYALLLLAGIALWLAGAWTASTEGQDARSPGGPDDLVLPGARGERSDEYVLGGGVGGAEGEGSVPALHAEADGGIGGAEGGMDAVTPAANTSRSVCRLTVLTLVALGAIGLLFQLWGPALPHAAVLVLALLGAAGLAAIVGMKFDRKLDE